MLTAPSQAAGRSWSLDPSTRTVTRAAASASYRENEILTNQTNITTRFNTGSIQHDLATGVEFIYEKQFTPTIGGPRHPRADTRVQPGPQRAVHRPAEPGPDRRVQRRQHGHERGCTRSTPGS